MRAFLADGIGKMGIPRQYKVRALPRLSLVLFRKLKCPEVRA